MNIRFNAISGKITTQGFHRFPCTVFFALITVVSALYYLNANAASIVMMEPVQACVVARDAELTPLLRSRIAHCLGWQETDPSYLCLGFYKPLDVKPLSNPNEVQLFADQVSFYNQGRSELQGHVEVRQTSRVLNAQTAYVYRDTKSNSVNAIELLGEVKYLEPGRLMIARKAVFHPVDKSGRAEDVLFRFSSYRPGSVLPAWGQAGLIERFANKDYLLRKATYSTCAPQDNAWHLEADSIALNNAKATGVARNARLYVGKVPLIYMPYMSFPTSKERKSGFLFPVLGTSNVGGFDMALPYYWNISPNYDATLTPHLYTRRGLMMGGQFRYLTEKSYGQFNARYLSHDRAYTDFLHENQFQYPQLRGASTDRWSLLFRDITQVSPNLQLKMNLQDVSDDYFLQDFDSNLSLMTKRQLLREGELNYTTDNWLFRGLVQSYQTLQPINQTPVSDIYQRLPQLLARGFYDNLPLNGQLTILGQFDNFRWSNNLQSVPDGPRSYFNPVLSLPQMKPWGYFTPSVELVQNYYDIQHYNAYDHAYVSDARLQRSIPRYSLDGGLYFERQSRWLNSDFTQTLEPRLFYLNVPFRNQTNIPVYDSAFMIFNTDQLFRTNRFSGYDRTGDANQLAYALTTRWTAVGSGVERASFTIGQIQYFANRRVTLCQSVTGSCVDNPLDLGYLSPVASSSPIATRAVYYFNPSWIATGDYVWDPNTHATNNGHLDFHYQPAFNQLLGIGYTYLANGDITQVGSTSPRIDPLHQASFSYAWPFTERWSSMGAYGYNISKGYEMMSIVGLQYDNCCWAVRLMGGRSFQSLNFNGNPQYNNNVYLQVQLKGLGSVGTSDPGSNIRTYIPGYVDTFHR